MKTSSIEQYDNVAEHYDNLAKNGPFSTLAPHNSGGRKSQYVAAVFDNALLNHLTRLYIDTPIESLLDLGCGTGIFSKQAAIISKNVLGVDLSIRMLQLATKVCNKHKNTLFIQVDGVHLPFRNNSFSTIIARESLCYVKDDLLNDMVKQIYLLLKPGGYFLWLEQVSNNTRWQKHSINAPLTRRSPSTLRTIATEAGFRYIDEHIVRVPRFPVIYPVWFGLFPQSWIPRLAKFEVNWHKNHPSKPHRWWDNLLILKK